MAITNATRLSDFAAGIGTEGAILKIDNANQRVGIGTQLPDQMLQVAGIVSATQYIGDGSLLEGITSAGLGTAIDDTDGSAGAVIYYTDDLLTVSETTTVNPPTSASAAYTQYRDVKLEDNVDLIIETGDDFIPDVLGLGTDASDPTLSGNGVFDEVYTSIIKNKDGFGAPVFPNGLTSVGVITAASGSFSGNVTVGGVLTYEDVTNVDSVGLITARTGIKVTAGGIDVTGNSSIAGNLTLPTADAKLNLRDSNNYLQFLDTDKTFKFNNSWGAGEFTFHVNGGERLRIGSAGQLGLGGANYGTSGQVLTSQGGSAAPQWATPSAGGMVPLLSTNPTSGDEIFATTNLLNSTYKHYRLEFYYQGANGEIKLQQYVGSGYQTSNTYDYRTNIMNHNNTTWYGQDSTQPFMPVSANHSRPTWQGTIDIYNPTNTTKQTTFVSSIDGWDLSIPWTIQNGNNLNGKTVCAADADGTVVAVTGFKLYGSTITSAFATLYGMKTA